MNQFSLLCNVTTLPIIINVGALIFWLATTIGKIDAIREKKEQLDFGLHGHVDHLTYSFGVARGAEA